MLKKSRFLRYDSRIVFLLQSIRMRLFLKFILISNWDYDLHHYLMSSNESGNNVDEETLNNVDKRNCQYEKCAKELSESTNILIFKNCQLQKVLYMN